MASPTDKNDSPTLPTVGAVQQSLSSLIASLERGSKVVMLLSAVSGTGKSSLVRSWLKPAPPEAPNARNRQHSQSKKRSPKRAAGLVIHESTSPRGGQPHLLLDIGAGSLSAAVWASFDPTDDPLVERTVSQVVERVPEIVRARRQEMTEGDIEALVDLFLKEDPLSEAHIAIKMDNARERARFLTEVDCLTSRHVAENAGHQAANASVTGSRWKQRRKIFSVPWKGNELYPAFQFRDGLPHPTIGKVLRELPKRMSPWQIAFWFTSGNGWLNGATPANRLDDEAAVVMAAQREHEPIVG